MLGYGVGLAIVPSQNNQNGPKLGTGKHSSLFSADSATKKKVR